MRRLDDDPSEVFIKLGVMGESGSGKTWLGITAPKPLVLVWERQAVAAIRAGCAERGIPVPVMLLIETVADAGNVIRAMHGDRTKPFVVWDRKTREKVLELPEWPLTLVIDSITDAAAMQRGELLKEAPPARGDSGLPDESFAHRRILKDRIIQLIRAFRNVPAHVVFLALRNDKDTYKNKRKVGVRWLPDLPDKELPSRLMQAVNAFGVMYIGRHDGGIRHAILFGGEDWQGTKSFPPLRRYETPDLTELFGRIQGTWTAEVTAAPPPSDDMEVAQPDAAIGVENGKPEGGADLSFGFELEGAAAAGAAAGAGLAAATDAMAADPEPPPGADSQKRARRCGVCHDEGHDARTCPEAKAAKEASDKARAAAVDADQGTQQNLAGGAGG